MRHVKMLGLCLVAVFALGAVVAIGSASAAEPEWGRCVATKGGHFKNNSCTEEATVSKKTGKFTGKYEWQPGAPKTGECVKEKHGQFKNSTCTEEAAKSKSGTFKGKFEKLSPQFKGAGGASVLDATMVLCTRGNQNVNELCEGLNGKESYTKGTTINDSKIECTSETAEGELSGEKQVANVNVAFHGCHFGGIKCYNIGDAVEGEVKVNPLVGELGYISKAKKEVGVVLHPASGGVFATFECNHGALYIEVGAGPDVWKNRFGTETEEPWYSGSGHDGIISPVVPVDKMAGKFTQEYKVALRPEEHEGNKYEAPENVPSAFEGGPTELLESWLGANENEEHRVEEERFPWGPSGEEVTNVNTGHGEVEIKA